MPTGDRNFYFTGMRYVRFDTADVCLVSLLPPCISTLAALLHAELMDWIAEYPGQYPGDAAATSVVT